MANALVVPAAIPGGWRLVQCLENQDVTFAPHSDAARVAMLADSSDRTSWYARSRSRTATGLLLAAPGIPALFMGQEFLEDKNWSDNRLVDGLISWEALDGAGSASRDFLKFVADMIRLRRSQPARKQRPGVTRQELRPGDRPAQMDRRRRPRCRRDSNLAEQPKQDYAIGLPFAGTGWNCSTATCTTIFQMPRRSAMADGFGLGVNRWTVSRQGPPLRFLRTA